MPVASAVTKADGSLDFSGGVNSIKVTTIQSQQNPNGLARNELAWLDNCTCRDGGITQRFGWLLVGTVHDGSALFQGKFMYEPIGADPYEVWSVGGVIYKVDMNTGAVTNLSALFGLTNPPMEEFAFFVQAEEFLIIQAGDGVTLPLFWDGTTLRRSNGLTGFSAQTTAGGTFTIDPVSFWTVPAVLATVVIPIEFMYGGIVLDTGTYGVIGTFQVTAFTAVAPFTITLQTVSSSFVGANISAVPAPFIVGAATTTNPINEIPAATCMDYYMGRLWYAQDRQYTAGDIVLGASGTAAYGFRDSVLKVTENPLAIGGDGFTLPSQAGNIRALKHGAAIDVVQGQGRLFILTRKAVYALTVPVQRADWIAATASNQPLQTVVQLVNGSVNDRSVVVVNGDLFYQSIEPGIRSLMQSIRYFTQWGNIQISANEQRITQFNDRSLLRAASGMFFENYLYQTALPKQTPQGIVHQALIPMDFIPISGFGQQKQPVWLGMNEGVDILQLATGDFSGRDRAFAAVVNRTTAAIELWEITSFSKEDKEVGTDGNRVVWIIETPAFTWSQSGWENELKKLVSAELWIDRLFGTVQFILQYRPDGQACWNRWHEWKKCSPKNANETVAEPIAYPLVPCLESYASTMIMPKPPESCASATGRPGYIAYQFQARLIIKGFCRVRGFWLIAEKVERALYTPDITC